MGKRKRKKKNKSNKFLENIYYIVSISAAFVTVITMIYPVIPSIWIISLIEKFNIFIDSFFYDYTVLIQTFFTLLVTYLVFFYFFPRRIEKFKQSKLYNTVKIIFILLVSLWVSGEIFFISNDRLYIAEEGTEENKIEYYIVRASKKVISINELEGLSNVELYYVRNGIFAYCGYKFTSGYYERFDWYNGTIEAEFFTWDMLNSYQQENVNNIQLIEKQRNYSGSNSKYHKQFNEYFLKRNSSSVAINYVNIDME